MDDLQSQAVSQRVPSSALAPKRKRTLMAQSSATASRPVSALVPSILQSAWPASKPAILRSAFPSDMGRQKSSTPMGPPPPPAPIWTRQCEMQTAIFIKTTASYNPKNGFAVVFKSNSTPDSIHIAKDFESQEDDGLIGEGSSKRAIYVSPLVWC